MEGENNENNENSENNVAPESSQQAEKSGNPVFSNADISMLMDVNMALSIEIGRAEIKLTDLLSLSKGSIIELDKMSGEPLDIYANGKLIAHGDVVSVNGKYGIRLTSMPKKPSNNDG